MPWQDIITKKLHKFNFAESLLEFKTYVDYISSSSKEFVAVSMVHPTLVKI